MRVSVDTNVLLQAFDRSTLPRRALQALWKLRFDGHDLATTSQNIAEFWNVSTRPTSARGGLGLSVALTERRVRIIERYIEVLPYSRNAYDEWRRLIVAHQIAGVGVHDARIVASMHDFQITHLLTLNARDFQRYAGLTVLTS